MASLTVSSSMAGKPRGIVLSDLTSGTYETLAAAPARVYHAKFSSKQLDWSPSHLSGLLVLGQDTLALGTKRPVAADADELWLRLIDEASARTVWMLRLPVSCEYRVDKPFFHVFAGRSRMWGLLFFDDGAASVFARTVATRVPGNARSAAVHVALPLRAASRSRSKTRRRTGTVSAAMISAPAPETFVHIGHVGISRSGVIETQGVDAAWADAVAGLAAPMMGVVERSESGGSLLMDGLFDGHVKWGKPASTHTLL